MRKMGDDGRMKVDPKALRLMSQAEALAEVMRHTVGNRREIEASKLVGCVSCCDTFFAKQVQEWQDEWTTPQKQRHANRWTAKCRRCGEPTLIGSATGLLDDEGFLPTVKCLREHQLKPTRR